MSDKKLLVVFGSTGIQGGSVINSVLNDPKTAATFKIRGVTRDVTKPAAEKLKERGVEVVSANMDEKASLKAALEGAYAVFAVTNFWEHMDPERETRQGINVAEVAAELGVQHFIYSSLINVTEVSKGRYTHVAHFDAKANIETHIRTHLPQLPSTFFLPGFYMSNLSSPSSGAMFPYDPSTKTYSMSIPVPIHTEGIPIFDAARDTGKFVKAILTKREETLGKRVLGATKYASPKELAEGFEKVRGVKAVAEEVKLEEWEQRLPEPLRKEMGENMEMMGTTGYYGHEGLEWSTSLLDEPATTWEEFVAQEKGWADLKQ